MRKHKWEDEVGWKRWTTYCDYLVYEAPWIEKVLIIGGSGTVIGFVVRSWTG